MTAPTAQYHDPKAKATLGAIEAHIKEHLGEGDAYENASLAALKELTNIWWGRPAQDDVAALESDFRRVEEAWEELKKIVRKIVAERQ